MCVKHLFLWSCHVFCDYWDKLPAIATLQPQPRKLAHSISGHVSIDSITVQIRIMEINLHDRNKSIEKKKSNFSNKTFLRNTPMFILTLVYFGKLQWKFSNHVSHASLYTAARHLFVDKLASLDNVQLAPKDLSQHCSSKVDIIIQCVESIALL